MARKKKHPEHENHERWLISYADFITLLFAFFVVMFASSQADKKKAQQVQQSVTTALEKGAQASAKEYVPRGREDPKGKGGSEPGKDEPAGAKSKDPGKEQDKDKEEGKDKDAKDKPASPKEAIAADLGPSMKAMNEALSKEIKAGKVEVHMEVRGLVVSLHEGAFFGSGDDKVVPSSYDSISKIAETMKGLKNPVRLEGHTDSIPIHTDHFQSNWELSAARSIAMMNLLSTKYSIPRQQMGIAGYADTMPVDDNKTAAGRARNRRVDIVVLNADAANQNKPADPAGAKPEAAKAHEPKTAAADTNKGDAKKPEDKKPVAPEVAKAEPPKAPPASAKPSPLPAKGRDAKK